MPHPGTTEPAEIPAEARPSAAPLPARLGVLGVLGVWAALTASLLGAAAKSQKTTPAAQDPDVNRQRRICFPPSLYPRLRAYRGEGVILWTDAPLAGKAVLGRLQATAGLLRALLPAPGTRPAKAPTTRPVAIAVYARGHDYRRLWPRAGAYYDADFGQIATDGYSYRVFCATSCDGHETPQARRSVICHEFTHVWLYQNRGLRNDGNWLTEGLATAVQLHFFPESGDRAQFVRWLDTGRMLPLKRLMDLRRIAPKDYWQAGTLAELLMLRYRRKLPAVISAFNEGKSAYAIVSGVLETDFATLERQWSQHVRRSARPAKVPAATESAGEGRPPR